MKLLKGFLILTAGAYLTGCSKVIDVDLSEAPPKLVIDASIDWIKNSTGNEQRIKLSTTTGYYNADFPTVSGAKIAISNSTNAIFNFIETANAGEYLCTDFKPVVNETYKLMILLNGITYSAVETLTATPEIDNGISHNTKGGMTGDEIEIQFSYQDNGAEDNYYMTRINTNRIAFPQFELESDERYQGNKIIEFYSHEDLELGDSLTIKLYGTTKRFYDYFTKIITASGSDGSPFSTIPTAVRGNIINQTDSKNYPLGYFRLSEVVTRKYTIK